jgi:hypothetical protein
LQQFGDRVGAYLAPMDDRYPATDDQQSVRLGYSYPDATELNRWLPLITRRLTASTSGPARSCRWGTQNHIFAPAPGDLPCLVSNPDPISGSWGDIWGVLPHPGDSVHYSAGLAGLTAIGGAATLPGSGVLWLTARLLLDGAGGCSACTADRPRLVPVRLRSRPRRPCARPARPAPARRAAGHRAGKPRRPAWARTCATRRARTRLVPPRPAGQAGHVPSCSARPSAPA